MRSVLPLALPAMLLERRCAWYSAALLADELGLLSLPAAVCGRYLTYDGSQGISH